MVTDGLYYFNRCRRCNGLITKLQIKAAFDAGTASVCPCGSGMFGPTNPLWYEWFYPRSLAMIVAELLGNLAPPPESGMVPPVMIGRPVAPLSADERNMVGDDE